jgi:uncharacterized phage infection (PIP) family protein YhgE
MKPTIQLPLILLLLIFHGATAVAAESGAGIENNGSPQYLRVDIDRVVIDTEGLIVASSNLAASIEQLAQAIQQLSANSASLSAEEKEILLGAVESVDAASRALSSLANQLPQAAQDLTAQLPQMVRDARQPIAELSSGLASAHGGIVALTESLPQATENAKQLVNSTLDSALIRFSTYTIILIAALALALIGVMWFVYRQYLDPLAKKLDSLVGAPEHFAAMSRHMKQTSDNLLALQPAAAVSVQPQDDESSPDTGASAQDSSADTNAAKPKHEI